MIIKVDELRKEKANIFKFNEKIDMSGENTDDFSFVDLLDVSIEVKLLRTEVVLSVEYTSNVEYSCVRCLKKFVERIEGKFETEFLEREDYEDYVKSEEKEHYFDVNETVKELLVQEQIKTEEIIRDYVLLNINEYPVCKIECEGLAALEQYKDSGIDPRFQKLLDIMNNSSKI